MSVHPSLLVSRHLQFNDKKKPFRLLFLVHANAIAAGAMAKYKSHFSGTFGDAAFIRVDGKNPPPKERSKEWKRARFVFCLWQSCALIDSRGETCCSPGSLPCPPSDSF